MLPSAEDFSWARQRRATCGRQEPAARMLALVRGRPGLGLDEWPDRRVLALLRVIRNNVAVTRAHRPGRVHCPLLFFAAARTPPGLAGKLAGYGISAIVWRVRPV